MKDMVSVDRTSRELPTWIHDTLWQEMTKYWDTDAAMAKSSTTSAARMSDRNDLGVHKHNSGQKSYLQIEQELVVELGRPVSFAEVFIKAHTKSDGTFVDYKAQKVAETYKKKKQEKLISLETDDTENSDGQHPVLSLEDDNELFIQSTFTNKRGHIFGIGSLKTQLKDKSTNPRSFSAFMQLQQQLKDAQHQLEEQAALIAKAEEERTRQTADAAKAEEERSRVAAAQQARINELTLVEKYISTTDPRFLDFIAKESTSSASTHD